MADDGSGLILSEAQRQLASQETSLSEVRSRALALLSVAGLVAGVAGPVARRSALSFWIPGGIGIGLLILSIVLALSIVTPQEWTFAGHLNIELTELHEGKTPSTAEVVYRRAYWLEEWRNSNQPKLDKLFARLTWLIVAVGASVVSFAVAALI
jgi:hypothetical protein